MKSVVSNLWSLFFAMLLVGLCTGLQSSLLTLRGVIEGFSTSTIGWIMSSYFVGFMIGTSSAPRLIARVGHIRAFGAFASLASVAVLVHAIAVEPSVWFVMRLLSGFCFSGIYVVAESWINANASNENRGKVFSFYVILLFGGTGAGQTFLSVSDPEGFELFTLASILISVALIPLLATRLTAPSQEQSSSVSLSFLWKTAPLGLVCTFFIQGINAGLFVLAPAYFTYIGMQTELVGFLIATIVAGNLLTQWPIGLISDKFDRRIIIAVATFVSALICLLLSVLDAEQTLLIFSCCFLLGAFCLPVYAFGVAHTNDFLSKEHMVGASSQIIRVGALGGMFGVLLISHLMEWFSAWVFFVCFICFASLVGLFALYRISRRQRPGRQQGSDYNVLSPQPTSETVVAELAKEGEEFSSTD